MLRVYRGIGEMCPRGFWHLPPSSETCNGRRFALTRFEYWQQPGNFQRSLQVRPEITKLQASASRFCLSVRFDQCAQAGAVHIIDVLQIDNNPCAAGCQEIVNHRKQPAALLSEHKTSIERQKIDSIYLTLRYFQRHRLPPQGHYADSRMYPYIIASAFP